jgi:hypothetical protein
MPPRDEKASGKTGESLRMIKHRRPDEDSENDAGFVAVSLLK